MSFHSQSSQVQSQEPLFFIGEMPIRLITLLVAVHIAAMVTASFFMAFGRFSWMSLFVYNSSAVLHGQAWRLVTYAFVNPPTLWFALEMLMLAYFGREVERGLGAKFFGVLYAGLILLGSGLLQLLSFIGIPQELSGAQSVNFALFAAFISMCPGLPFFFGLTGRSLLAILVALSSLQLLAGHQFSALFLLLAESLGAIFFMQWRGYGNLFERFALPSFTKNSKQKKVTTLPKTAPANPVQHSLNSSIPVMPPQMQMNIISLNHVASEQTTITTSSKEKALETVNIDTILEKIGKSGLASLTEEEKDQLEAARKVLLQRDGIF